MPEPTPARVLLIDLDNCPRQLRHLPEAVAGFAKVIACHGGADPKVSLSLLPMLANALHEGKLEVVHMRLGGPNAADFGLAFWAGRLVERMAPDAEFIIFSADRDLDHVVQLLAKAGRRVERLDGNKLEPVVISLDRSRPPAVTAHSLQERLREYQKMHLSRSPGRPTRHKALFNSLRAFCKDHPGPKPEELLQGLIDGGHISIDGVGRVTYVARPIGRSPDESGQSEGA
jgi:PIN domain